MMSTSLKPAVLIFKCMQGRISQAAQSFRCGRQLSIVAGFEL